jgi:hypothetical protein
VPLIDAKACIGVDGWGLNFAFLMNIPKCWNDTTCVALEIPHVGSLTLIPIGGGAPPLCPSKGHPLDRLELFLVMDAFSIWWSLKVEDHLWNHCLTWLIPCVDVIPLERTFYHGTTRRIWQ